MSEHVKYGSDEDCGLFASDFTCNLLVQIFCGYIYAFNIGWIRCKYVWLVWCTMMFFSLINLCTSSFFYLAGFILYMQGAKV